MNAAEVCSWCVTREGIEQPCDKPAVAWSYNPPDAEPCDPFPVCPAHARVGIALTLDDPNRPGATR